MVAGFSSAVSVCSEDEKCMGWQRRGQREGVSPSFGWDGAGCGSWGWMCALGAASLEAALPHTTTCICQPYSRISWRSLSIIAYIR